jgi:GTP-binding protein HflX
VSFETGKLERAILVGVIHGKNDEQSVDEHLDELELLSETAGAEVVGRVTQKVSKINPAFFIGKGKAEQIVRQAKELDANLLIFDDDLSPAQTKNFQKLADNLKVIDRSALILDIFRKHAKTKEAKTQVELAHLQYILPGLTRMWTHLERQMGGIGTRAGAGETQIEVDRRLVRQRIGKLKKELKRIDRERVTQGKRRKDLFKVAIVGYTNAGKSTLMQALTGEEVFIQDQLFATLDTTIRSVSFNGTQKFLLSDTVGFIRKLPHHLVASFRSTLKEVIEGNLILIVLDASSQQVMEHLETIHTVLEELKADKHKTLLVLNKIDLIHGSARMAYLKRIFPEGILISARSQLRIDQLMKNITRVMDETSQTVNVFFSFEQGRELAVAQEGVEVLERSYDDDGIRLKIRGSPQRINQIILSTEK